MQYSEIILSLSLLSKNYNDKLKKELKKVGIKVAYCKLLSALAAEDGGTQLSLVERTGLKAPTVSIVLRKMEKDGFVTRKSDEIDLRRTHVFLTDKGKNANKLAIDVVSGLQKKMFSSVSDDEMKTFIGVIQKIEKEIK